MQRTLISPLPLCVDVVSLVECDVDLMVVVVITVAVIGPPVHSTRYLLS